MGMAVAPVKLYLWMVESEFHVIFHVSQSVLLFLFHHLRKVKHF